MQTSDFVLYSTIYPIFFSFVFWDSTVAGMLAPANLQQSSSIFGTSNDGEFTIPQYFESQKDK